MLLMSLGLANCYILNTNNFGLNLCLGNSSRTISVLSLLREEETFALFASCCILGLINLWFSLFLYKFGSMYILEEMLYIHKIWSSHTYYIKVLYHQWQIMWAKYSCELWNTNYMIVLILGKLPFKDMLLFLRIFLVWTKKNFWRKLIPTLLGRIKIFLKYSIKFDATLEYLQIIVNLFKVYNN